MFSVRAIAKGRIAPKGVMAMTEVKGIRTTVFNGVERLRIHNLTLQGGVTATLCFTVSENADDKKVGDFHQVEGLVVTFDNVHVQNILADAMARKIVKWAPSLRENPTRIKELSGKTVRFDEPLFADLAKKARTVTVARPPTEEEIKTYLASQSLAGQMRTTIDLMRVHGMDSSLMEAELEALLEVEKGN